MKPYYDAKPQVSGGIMRGPGQLTLHPAHSPNLSERSEPMTNRTCSVDACLKAVHARGWCQMHYVRWKTHGDPMAERKSRICSIDGCGAPHAGRGYCLRHYNSWKRHGDPTKAGPLKTPHGAAQAFVASIFDGTAPREPSGCIIWPFATTDGYARLRIKGRNTCVGWLVLEHFVGPKPSEDHSMGHAPHEVCGDRRCVSPDHLSWQTWVEQAAQQRRDQAWAGS